MNKVFRNNFRRILALTMSVSMILGTDVSAFADTVTAEETIAAETVVDTEGVVVDSIQEGDILAAQDDYIQLNNSKFAEYFNKYSANYGTGNNTYRPSENGGYDISWPSKANVEQYESFNVEPKYVSYYENGELKDVFNITDLSDLNKLTNVTSLKISNLKSIKNIALPASVKVLTVENCHFNCVVDLSGCINLETIVFKNNSFEKDEYKKIKGLSKADHDSLLKLTDVDFSNSAISELYFAESGQSADRPTLTLSAENCEELFKISSGGYWLKNSVNLRGCKGLLILEINGYVDANGHSLDVTYCYKLGRIRMNYYFSSDNINYTFNAGGISATNGLDRDPEQEGDVGFVDDAYWAIQRAEGSKPGAFYLLTMANSYIDRYAQNEVSEFINDIAYLSDKIKYIVFEEDRYRFEKMKLWEDGKSSFIRTYEANPAKLFTGQSIDNATPNFYSEDGLLIHDVPYEVEVENLKIPTSIENDKREEYNVISWEKSEKGVIKINALNPGMAKLKITTANGSSVSDSMIVVVHPNVKTFEINSSPMTIMVEDKYNLWTQSTKSQTFWISTKMTIDESASGLEEYINGAFDFELYKQNSDGNSWDLIDATAAGLNVYRDSSSKKLNDAGEIVYDKSKLVVNSNAEVGRYMIKGYVADNCKDADQRVATDEHFQFDVQNKPSDEIGYISKSAAGRTQRILGEATFEITGYGDEYVVCPSIRESYINERKLILFDDIEKYKYKMRFDSKYSDGDNAADIAEKLRQISNVDGAVIDATKSNGQPGYVATVDFDLYKDDKYDATVTKKVAIYGCFSVDYDLNGGTFESEVKNTYTIPSLSPSENAIKVPVKPGFTFAGWKTADGTIVTEFGKNVLGDISLKAFWNLIKYSITYNLDGGVNNSENPTEYTISSNTIILKEPTKAGYTFKGFYTSDTATEPVTKIERGSHGDITLIARWEPVKNQPGNNADDKDNTNTTEDGNNNSDKPSDQPITAEDITPKVKKITEEVSISVLPKDSNGNVVPVALDEEKLITVTEKKVVFAKAKDMPAVEGYTFNGWYIEGSNKKISSVPAKRFTTLSDAKIIAVYVENTYAVQYKLTKPKGSKISGKPQKLPKVRYSEEFNLSDTLITATIKANPNKGLEEKVYTLAGWTTTKDGTEVEYSLGQKVSKLAGKTKKDKKVVLYPVWK